MFKLVPDWFYILLTSYSAYAFYLLAGAILLPEFLYFKFDFVVNPYVVGYASLVFAGLGLLGRIVEQPPQGAWVRRLIVWGVLIALACWAAPAVAMTQLQAEEQVVGVSGEPSYAATAVHLVPLVKRWEGKHACQSDSAKHCSYFDRIASPPLWTVGYGHTETARSGQILTETQASELLQRDLVNYWSQVRRGFTPDTLAHRLTPERDAAFASLGYNVGTAGVRRSTATKRLNAGRVIEACAALTWWNKAGGRVVRGLTNRRNEEQTLCLIGT